MEIFFPNVLGSCTHLFFGRRYILAHLRLVKGLEQVSHDLCPLPGTTFLNFISGISRGPSNRTQSFSSWRMFSQICLHPHGIKLVWPIFLGWRKTQCDRLGTHLVCNLSRDIVLVFHFGKFVMYREPPYTACMAQQILIFIRKLNTAPKYFTE